MGIQRTREPEGREIIMRRALLLQLAEGIRMSAAMVLKCKKKKKKCLTLMSGELGGAFPEENRNKYSRSNNA